jgi:hypothetical protein
MTAAGAVGDRAPQGCDKTRVAGRSPPPHKRGMSVVSWRTTILGFLSWAIPFVASFAFVDRAGQWLIPYPLFKSIMVVVFGGLGTWFLVLAFRRTKPTRRTGLALGLYWLAINLVLDLIVLSPLTGMTVVSYMHDIGLRYLLIPIIATAIGAAAERAAQEARASP